MRLVPFLRGAAVVAAITACVDAPVAAPRSFVAAAPAFARSSEVAESPALAAMNASLTAAGVKNIAIDQAELLFDTTGFVDGGLPATTLIANNRTHLFSSQFVPSDPRRGGSPLITYLVDQSDGAVLANSPAGAVVVPNAVTEGAIDAAMQTWRDAPACGAPGIAKVADNGSDPDLVDGLVQPTLYGVGTPRADITFAGWLPRGFFDALTPNGSASILGVTFTFVFLNSAGESTDIDHDGYADVAFREIYFNRRFGWNTNLSSNNVDIQSVAVHEAGHAYGLAHFGKVFIDNTGTIKYAPQAIMNAVYVAPFRTLTGTDNASFCHAWANAH